jgi:long-chain acyl-CoA synthetase
MPNHIGQIPAAAALKFANKEALVFEGKTFSFSDINDLVERLAGGLSDLGIVQGDTVTLYAENSWEWVVSYFAIARLGAIINPVNTMLTPDEIEYVVRDCGAKAIIASPEKVDGIMGVKAVSDVSVIISFGSEIAKGTVSFEALIAANIPAPASINVDPAALSTIGYTSGTTGHPKGAMQSHKAVITNGAMTSQMQMRSS